jgi:cyanophycinase-like exopeptidase
LSGINKKPVNIVIISSPAGFQPNVKAVHEEISQFFQISLANFHPQVQIIYANSRQEANNPDLLLPLKSADYIFIGPGSPTYAVKNLKDTLLYQEVLSCVARGTSLSLSSAAVIAFSRFCLPVYEIYKAGFSLYWEEGLNFYDKIFQKLTVIPHFNNQEGGKKLDTSCCFMGKDRFDQLAKLLSEGEKLWGIDELTAAVIDLKSKEIKVMGKGNLSGLDNKVIY